MKTETMYTIQRDGSSFKEKSTFSSGMELGSTMKLNEDNWWKDNETNPTIHFKVCLLSLIMVLNSYCRYARPAQCFSILVYVRLYIVMAEVCRWLTKEKQRKKDSCVTDQ